LADNWLAPVHRVLVVEDHHLVGLLLAEMLEELGHEVCGIAVTEAAAVAMAQAQLPCLMIVDVRLGAGSGLAAVAEILRHRYVPHIYMSGDIVSLRAAPSHAVMLRKPFQCDELVVCIDSVFNARPVS
jgi:DNA-binding response OmpR family regulator